MKQTIEKKQSSLKLTSFKTLENKYYGEKGTPKRVAYEFAFTEEIIGEIIKNIRQSQHLTQEQVAQSLHIHKSNISKIENTVKSIRLDTFFKVLEALDTKMTIKFVTGSIYKEVEFA